MTERADYRSFSNPNRSAHLRPKVGVWYEREGREDFKIEGEWSWILEKNWISAEVTYRDGNTALEVIDAEKIKPAPWWKGWFK